MNKKVMVAMSGGVDSSVAAALLKKQGYEIIGVTLKLFEKQDIGITDDTKTCSALNDAEDARRVALKLEFPHYVFNFEEKFKDRVVDKFIKEYFNAKTPNPCIDCNRYIKFDELLKQAIASNCDYIATGHYAVIEYDESCGRYLLKKAKDKSKDQTYVLYSLTQEQLSKIIFPLGNLEKSDIRKIAEEKAFANANKPDSQDICFVKNHDYASFIQEYTNQRSKPGNFVDRFGNVLGVHKGIIHYTVGQRKGLGLSFSQPMFVLSKNKQENTVVLGAKEELYSKSLIATDVNFISVKSLKVPIEVTAKTRYSQSEQPAVIFPLTNSEVFIEFKTPQRAITPGQAVVFDDGDVVVGGGTILK
jgi:tRNA-specific 2-thiouridylase